MNEMIKRVDAALLCYAGVDPVVAKRASEGELASIYPASLYPEILGAARAAIAAMREPKPQILAMLSTYPLDVSMGVTTKPIRIWEDLIDEALK